MNRGAVWAIARKDLLTVVRNRGVRTPLIVAPFVILVLLPLLLVGASTILVGAVPEAMDVTDSPIGGLLDPSVQEQVLGGRAATGEAAYAIFVLEVFLAPLFLLVPLITATVIAADSFAGERERGTLEALLHTPTTDRELLTAKFLAAWIPAVTVALVGFFAYSLLANGLTASAIGSIWFPTVTWLILALFVTPALAALGLGVMVIASSRVKSLQAAHQVGSLMVLPVLVLLIAQITGTLLLSPTLVAVMGVLIWAAAAACLTLGAGSLRRQRLAASM
ncbi:ABC transporter permease [Nitriliruptor alkaliphilus]|uniref:ABC transporter permease n=1 Tax=Nitriliruptor alkaliphilus TaxID=427918 RepID=UPI000697CEA1|nr:ABC transporter permease subunit [Nitriliruptor alkaliphilus]